VEVVMNNAGRRMHERKLVWTAQGEKCADCGKQFPYYNGGVMQVLDANKRVEKMVCVACAQPYYTHTQKMTPEEARAELATLYTEDSHPEK
jgi:hypothetical protein